MPSVNTYVVYNDTDGAIRMIVKTLSPPSETPSGTSVLVTTENVEQTDRVELSDLTIASKYEFEDGAWSGDYFVVPVPPGTKAFWQGECHDVDDGSIEVLVDQPGEHLLKLTHPLYLTKDISIENQQTN